MDDSKLISQLWPRQKNELVLFDPPGSVQHLSGCSDLAVLSGSFNPLHQGHSRLRTAAREQLGCDVLYELSVVNADKGRLPTDKLIERLRQFQSPVAVTAAPLFADKAALFPGCCFVVGFDTAIRLLDARYYHNGFEGMQLQLSALQRKGHRFLVAARSVDGGPARTLADLPMPEKLDSLFTALPIERFCENISSTELRRQQSGFERERLD